MAGTGNGMILEPPEFEAAPEGIILRDYQQQAMAAINEGWKTYTRQLLDMATGTGKTAILNVCAAETWAGGGRTLILENRDALVRQTAKRAEKDIGLEVAIEMAGEHASPFAPVVVASVQTLCRDARLTGFADFHFDLAISDECHHSLSKSFAKVLNYFHYGAESLTENWKAPEDGTYRPKARILGVTATPELNGKRHLGEFYQHVPFTYQLMQAMDEGWLVPVLAAMEPLPANLKGLRAKRTPNGSDYDPSEVAERLIPIIEELAKQIVRLASGRKTMAYMPSIKTAAMLTDALNRHGLRSIFVSGACLDREPKTDEFVNHGPGIALVTAAMYTEGFDVPDVDCIFAGITKSRSYFIQKVGRATRPLRGLVDGLNTAVERKAAIAASAKHNFLIIDPFCRIDDIDLCSAYDLFCDKPEVVAKMKELGEPTPENAAKAERDFLKSMEKEARKAARKAAKTIDPIRWSLSIGDTAISSYTPQTAREMQPVSEGQIGFLDRNHIDRTKITCFGLADKIIGRFLTRHAQNKSTPQQLSLLTQLGMPELEAAALTKWEASAVIDKTLQERKRIA